MGTASPDGCSDPEFSARRFTDIGVGYGADGTPQPTWLRGVPGETGVVYVSDVDTPVFAEMRRVLRERHGDGPDDFSFTWKGEAFRVHRTRTRADGAFFVLRRIPSMRPRLEDPALRINQVAAAEIIRVARGPGLILVTGAPANGKTTTGVAAFVSTLERYGDVGVAIEDPIEYDMHGPVGPRGFCIQSEVEHFNYDAAIRGALRNSSSRAYVGEIRSPESASQVIRAANGALCVISTMHANDVPQALHRLHALASDVDGERAACNLIAGGLSAVVHQSLVRDPGTAGFRPVMKVLTVVQDDKTYERSIRQKLDVGDYKMVVDDLQQQMMRMKNRMHGP